MKGKALTQPETARVATLRFRILRMLARNQRDFYFTANDVAVALNEDPDVVLDMLMLLEESFEVRLVHRRAKKLELTQWDTTAEGIAAFTTEDVLFNRFMAHMGATRKN